MQNGTKFAGSGKLGLTFLVIFTSVVLCHNPLLPGLLDHEPITTQKTVEHWCIATVA